MQIQFKGTNYELASDMTARAERKIVALKKYLHKSAETAQVHVELGKETEAHQSGSIWRASIVLTSHGDRFHAAATAETLETAIDSATTELGTELQRAKKKRESLFRKGGMTLKMLLRRDRAT